MGSTAADSLFRPWKRFLKSARCCSNRDVAENAYYPLNRFDMDDSAPGTSERKMNEQVLKEFYIPKSILVPDSKAVELPRAPSYPV